MSIKSLLPSLWARDDSETDVVTGLQTEIDRVFNQFRDSALMPLGTSLWRTDGRNGLMPKIDVSETDKQVEVEVELPGVEAKDVDVTVVDQVLTIEGIKSTESEEEVKNYHLVERSQGHFRRVIPLGFDVDSDQVVANYQNGVLTITVKKPADIVSKVKKIEVKETAAA
ncbi:MAG: Hsp20/alpha crystallin family protein [Granulosicoccus sp.]